MLDPCPCPALHLPMLPPPRQAVWFSGVPVGAGSGALAVEGRTQPQDLNLVMGVGAARLPDAPSP